MATQAFNQGKRSSGCYFKEFNILHGSMIHDFDSSTEVI